MGDGAIRLQLTFWETMVNTWFIMLVLVGVSWAVTRRLRVESPISPLQHVMEILVEAIRGQIAEMAGDDADAFVPFVGTLFLFIFTANLLSIIPPLGDWFLGGFAFYAAPVSSPDTPFALALMVLFAVPVFAVTRIGVLRWLRGYLEPTPIMLPFNIIGDLSSTLALAVRLFGNMMSGSVIIAILLSIAPFIFPVIMQLFGLLTGSIQAFIFATLTMVYIASASQVTGKRIRRASAKGDE